MKLHLGVIDQQYKSGESVAEVATILERKYGIMQTFADKNLDYIAKQLANSVADQVDMIVKGVAIPNANTYAQASNNIEARFRDFLNKNGTGIVTAASTKGTSGRFKNASNSKGKRKSKKGGQVRPSFIATGLYQASMKVWTEE